MKQAALLRLRTILKRLHSLLDEERAAFTQRGIRRIAELLARKEKLLKEFDAAALGADAVAAADELAEELERLRAGAARNAELLNALRLGVRDARARLESLSLDDAKTGLYAREGDPLPLQAPASVTKTA